jgi:hypothetical protein
MNCLYRKDDSRYDKDMRKRFFHGKPILMLAAGALLFTLAPSSAQTGFAPRQVNQARAGAATPAARAPAQTQRQSQVQSPSHYQPRPVVQYRGTPANQVNKNVPCEGHQSWQGYNPYPVYPGPNTPLPPQGTYYYPNPYYNTGGWGNGYNPYYNNNYQYQPGPRSNGNYAPFQGY